MKIQSFVAGLGVCAFLFSSFGIADAKVKSKGTINRSRLSSVVDKHAVNVPLSSTASNTGELFMLTRDSKSKTRDLCWALFNPSSNKVIKKGKCPFNYDNKWVAISPNAKYAAAFSRHPAQLHILDIEANKWTVAYTNPSSSQEGLSIFQLLGGNSTEDSPLMFIDDNNVASVFHEMKIKDGSKESVNMVPVFFNVKSNKMTKGMSMSELLTAGEKAIKESGAVIDEPLSTEEINITGLNRYALTMKNSKKAFLVTFEGGKARVADSIFRGNFEYVASRMSDGTVFYIAAPYEKGKQTSARNSRELRSVKGTASHETIAKGDVFGGVFPEDGRVFVVEMKDGGNSYALSQLKKDGTKEQLATTRKSVRFDMGSSKNVFHLVSRDDIYWITFE